MQLTGAEIVIECLKEQGVDTVFGYPGGAILNVYDALYKHSDEITHILTRKGRGTNEIIKTGFNLCYCGNFHCCVYSGKFGSANSTCSRR